MSIICQVGELREAKGPQIIPFTLWVKVELQLEPDVVREGRCGVT